MNSKPLLLTVSEIGGYPNFTPLYEALGCEVVTETSMRKVLKLLKKRTPLIIIAEFNYQSDFRDRTSSLESMMSVVQRKQLQDKASMHVIIFYDREHGHQLDRVAARYEIASRIAFPIDQNELQSKVESILQQSS